MSLERIPREESLRGRIQLIFKFIWMCKKIISQISFECLKYEMIDNVYIIIMNFFKGDSRKNEISIEKNDPRSGSFEVKIVEADISHNIKISYKFSLLQEDKFQKQPVFFYVNRSDFLKACFLPICQ